MSAKGVANPKQGKKRKRNFTPTECNLLVNLVEQNLVTLRGQFSNTVTNAKKQKLWETITSKVNSLGYEKRTRIEIREKLPNMTQIAKNGSSCNGSAAFSETDVIPINASQSKQSKPQRKRPKTQN